MSDVIGGWTYVRFGDAAKAAQDGAHEIEELFDDGWRRMMTVFTRSGKYRMREKARTITVTIPRGECSPIFNACLLIAFPNGTERGIAEKAIRKAMEQS